MVKSKCSPLTQEKQDFYFDIPSVQAKLFPLADSIIQTMVTNALRSRDPTAATNFKWTEISAGSLAINAHLNRDPGVFAPTRSLTFSDQLNKHPLDDLLS